MHLLHMAQNRLFGHDPAVTVDSIILINILQPTSPDLRIDGLDCIVAKIEEGNFTLWCPWGLDEESVNEGLHVSLRYVVINPAS